LSATIYIVDDDEAVRDSARILLEAHGYEVQIFAAGPEFLAAFDGALKTCLILDINMPGMSGFEVLDLVRARWPRLPVIMITGRGDKAAKARALGNGAVALLEKPFGDVALVSAIEQALVEPAR
jgi:FixJ family two-component response regulator